LAHVEFLMAIEGAFDIQLSPRDVMNIKCMQDAERVLMNKLEA
jgi:acyl carrier protein